MNQDYRVDGEVVGVAQQADDKNQSSAVEAEEAKPFLAPCRQLPLTAAGRWLRAGWRDFRQAPRVSLLYGSVIVLISWLVSAAAWYFGSYIWLLAMLSGFIFVAPLSAVGLYSVSRHLARGRRPLLRRTWREMKRSLGQAMVYALVLLIIFLVWARAASMVHIFMPLEEGGSWTQLLTFLGVGSVVGSVFASVSFAASAFSLPMIAERDCDMITAVITSVNAVTQNKCAMLCWIACIIGITLIGLLTLGVGLAVAMPWLAYATWHAYGDCIDAQDWNELPLLARPKQVLTLK